MYNRKNFYITRCSCKLINNLMIVFCTIFPCALFFFCKMYYFRITFIIITCYFFSGKILIDKFRKYFIPISRFNIIEFISIKINSFSIIGSIYSYNISYFISCCIIIIKIFINSIQDSSKLICNNTCISAFSG